MKIRMGAATAPLTCVLSLLLPPAFARAPAAEQLNPFLHKPLAELAPVVRTNVDAELRYHAVRAAAAKGDTATGLLVEALDDRSPGVRYGAAQSLGERGADMADKALALLRDPNQERRVMGTVMLKYIGAKASPETTVPALVVCLKDRHFDVRMNAATALAVLGASAAPAVPALLDAAGDEEWWVRREAYFALASINTPQVRAALIELATTERHAALGWQDHGKYMKAVYADPALQEKLAHACGTWMLKEEGYINTFAARGKLENGLRGLEGLVKRKAPIPPAIGQVVRTLLADESRSVWPIDEKKRMRLQAILDYMDAGKGAE